MIVVLSILLSFIITYLFKCYVILKLRILLINVLVKTLFLKR